MPIIYFSCKFHSLWIFNTIFVVINFINFPSPFSMFSYLFTISVVDLASKVNIDKCLHLHETYKDQHILI